MATASGDLSLNFDKVVQYVHLWLSFSKRVGLTPGSSFLVFGLRAAADVRLEAAFSFPQSSSECSTQSED